MTDRELLQTIYAQIGVQLQVQPPVEPPIQPPVQPPIQPPVATPGETVMGTFTSPGEVLSATIPANTVVAFLIDNPTARRMRFMLLQRPGGTDYIRSLRLGAHMEGGAEIPESVVGPGAANIAQGFPTEPFDVPPGRLHMTILVADESPYVGVQVGNA